MEVSPERSWEARAPGAVNDDERGLGTLSVYALMNYRNTDHGAARGSPAVGRLDLAIGVLTGQKNLVTSCLSSKTRK